MTQNSTKITDAARPSREVRRFRSRKYRLKLIEDGDQIADRPFTKRPSWMVRADRRKKNRVAKAARKMNRGVYSGR